MGLSVATGIKVYNEYCLLYCLASCGRCPMSMDRFIKQLLGFLGITVHARVVCIWNLGKVLL